MDQRDDANERFFLDADNSAHWYLVRESIRETWDSWLSLPEDDEEAWTPPEGATRLGVHHSLISFTDPRQIP